MKHGHINIVRVSCNVSIAKVIALHFARLIIGGLRVRLDLFWVLVCSAHTVWFVVLFLTYLPLCAAEKIAIMRRGRWQHGA